MALASVGHSNKSLTGGTFVLGGSAYHRIGSLLPGTVCVANVSLFNYVQTHVVAYQDPAMSTNSPKFSYWILMMLHIAGWI
jgi:hypothetical protein